ncbi:MAG: TrkH family potassium uptake protein [Gammaproteobacteria bacterium]|nr:TrkH family potassium uptake protein [Gammaproteobacteria bacterium]MDP6616837.1 TrkH family potassium uptake protein [Gammaproteobacteria bacterium]MDP6694603.1 TrkH family potassium uptake protein [Gammaproteobacteria bacterium]
MRLAVVQRMLGLLLMMFSITMLPPVAISLRYEDGASGAFLLSFGITLCAGILIWLPVRRHLEDLRLRDGFLIVAAFWFGLGSFGSLPLMFLETPNISFTDAIFESMSGLTTTGATVLTGLDSKDISLLYYRQQLQWLGGMGIIVLAVAVLPMLGVGGMQLYRAEIAGPVKDTKLTPRITETAKALWYIYLGLTIACGLAYYGAGMSRFDALCHAFSTVAIGGFSTHDASIGYFNSTAINGVAVFFMFAAGINFSLHFLAWRGKSLMTYIGDSEFRAYAKAILALSVVTILYLFIYGEYDTPKETFNQGLFQVVSIATTTGFTTTDFSLWPGALPVVLIFASFVGACAGSTGGGMKVMRCLLLYRQGVREIKRLVHPNAEIPVKLGGNTIPTRVIESVWGFFAVYVAVFIVMMVIMLMDGVDQVTAFSAVAASLNNLGPGLGEVAGGYGGLSDLSKWVCVIAMLLGRLEIFTLLVLISPTFWEH